MISILETLLDPGLVTGLQLQPIGARLGTSRSLEPICLGPWGTGGRSGYFWPFGFLGLSM